MTKPRIILLILIVVTGAIVSWGIYHQGVVRLQQADMACREQAEELARVKEESVRLSNLIARSKPSGSLSDTQFRELMRLRGEVGQRRGEAREIAQIDATNRQLSAILAESGGAPVVPVHWAREQMAFAGYADPESAMISTLWALSNGDPSFYRAMLSAGEKEESEGEGNPQEIAEQYKKIGEMLYPSSATGISVVGKKENSPDEAVVDLYYEGEGKTRKFVVRKVDGQWKLHDMVSITSN